ncbi:hypothetical protein CVT26_015818 [Gymnopilus dilepis]|uniref:Uncharacterized protein n=1 Tax=Gymnopilus dilepis TaxID=231916 RepID=A0A409WAG2_9AGAR|nr:hypothetical protein CVT26_015818 [Gymnopilus dilepis]
MVCTYAIHFLGGGARYPYPKYVYSPAGGWWTRPSNWATNTAVAFSGILAVTYFVWNISANLEVRTWSYCFVTVVGRL